MDTMSLLPFFARSVVSDDEVLPAKAGGGAEIPELLNWTDEEDRRMVLHVARVGCCSYKIVPESCRSFQRYRHLCVTATLCPMP